MSKPRPSIPPGPGALVASVGASPATTRRSPVRAIASVTLAASLVALVGVGVEWPGSAVSGETAAREQPLDPAVSRCVLDNLSRSRGYTSGDLVLRACQGLLGPDPGGSAQRGAGYLVECRVPGDPEWVEFRLVTRTQCEQANGVAATR